MEISLIRSLMDKEFYDEHKGSKCPNRLFSKDIQKIKFTIDKAIETYGRSVQPNEVEALFLTQNPTLTTAQKTVYSGLFASIKKESPMGKDIAQEVLSKLFRQVVGEDIANLGFDYVNGTKSSLEPLRSILDSYGEDFIPNLNIEWDDISLETLMAKNSLETKWGFNIPSLVNYLEGINSGHLIEVGARPNTGKTSFHASLIASENGFASQGAFCIILCNEEHTHRVGSRYLTAATGLNMYQIKDNLTRAHELYNPVKKNIKIKEAYNKDMDWVESICKTYKPDIVVLDMGDKFKTHGTFAREDQALKANAIYARQIAKTHGCAMFYMSQLSAEAEGKVLLNQSMMEGSRTGKAAEADVMMLIAKNPPVETPSGEEKDDMIRHINIVKNKLSGWHGKFVCQLDYLTARYSA
jgi:hypothetical protein